MHLENEALLSKFHDIMKNLKTNENRFEILETIELKINSMNAASLIELVKAINLGDIFDCLNTSNKDELNLTVGILKKLLCMLEPHDIIKLYGADMGRAIEHPDIECKKLVVYELKKAAAHHNDLNEMISKESPLLVSAIECIKNEDFSLGTVAMKLLIELGKTKSGIQSLFSSPVIDNLKNVASTNDTIRYRVYDVIVGISSNSIEGLNAAKQSGLLKNLIDEVESSDMLVQMTSLQSITNLALTDHGLKYLKDEKVLDYINSICSQSVHDINPILLPGYIKFFGNIAQRIPQYIVNEYGDVMNMVIDLHSCNDIAISNVALETIGFIGSTPAGKLALNRYEMAMLNVMDVLVKNVLHRTTEQKIVALNVFANLMLLQLQDQSPEVLTITSRWYKAFNDYPMKLLKGICETPIKELKLAGFHALSMIAVQPWGQTEILRCAGMIEYLLDRNEVSDMNCITAKFDIVKLIYGSPHSKKIFPSEVCDKFRLHISQGVIYVEARTEIAMDGE